MIFSSDDLERKWACLHFEENPLMGTRRTVMTCPTREPRSGEGGFLDIICEGILFPFAFLRDVSQELSEVVTGINVEDVNL